MLERVQNERDKTKIVWLATLTELRESRQTYEKNKDWIVIFEDADIRKRVFRYYLRSSDLINSLEYQQRRKYELEGKFNDLVRDIKVKTPELSLDQARETAISFMQQESDEYRGLEASLPMAFCKLCSKHPCGSIAGQSHAKARQNRQLGLHVSSITHTVCCLDKP